MRWPWRKRRVPSVEAIEAQEEARARAMHDERLRRDALKVNRQLNDHYLSNGFAEIVERAFQRDHGGKRS
jgi:hypothetical protein